MSFLCHVPAGMCCRASLTDCLTVTIHIHIEDTGNPVNDVFDRTPAQGTFCFDAAEITESNLRTYPRAYQFKSNQLLHAII